MNKLLAVLALCTVLQVVHCQDTALVKCLQKITQEINTVQSTKKIPDCVDQEEVNKLLEHTEYFKALFEQVTKACMGGMSECTGIIIEIMTGKQNEIKESVSESLGQLIGAFSGCIDPLRNRMSNLQEYIRNGCEDPQ